MDKKTKILLLLFPAWLGFACVTQAADNSPNSRETLKQYVAELQNNANDQALREKIIKLAQSIKPAPAIPEEARRHFVKAVTLQKEAKGPKDYGLAIAEYRQALLLAPWWPEAMFNLGVALEATGQYDEAKRAWTQYLLTQPSEANARQAQDKIYGLEAKEEKLAKETTTREESEHVAQAKYGWLDGEWGMVGDEYFDGDHRHQNIDHAFYTSRLGGQITFWQRLYPPTPSQKFLRGTIQPSSDINWEMWGGDNPFCHIDGEWVPVKVRINSVSHTIDFRSVLHANHDCIPLDVRYTLTHD